MNKNEMMISSKEQDIDLETKDKGQRIFDNWSKNLEEKNLEVVAKMYTDDATFFPTLNDELKRGVEGAKKYFEHFLEKNPTGKVVEADAVLSEDKKEIAFFGVYDFEVDSGHDDERDVVRAEFTFVFKLADDEWKISHHHSALVKENLQKPKLSQLINSSIADIEEVFYKDFEKQTSSKINESAMQISQDKKFVIFSVMHNSLENVSNRSTIIFKAKENNRWELVHHQFSICPE